MFIENQKETIFSNPNPMFSVGYLITLVFIEKADLYLFKKLNNEYTDFLSNNYNFREVILPFGRKLEEIVNTDDELQKLRTKTIEEYPQEKRKTVLLVPENVFNCSKAYQEQSDNVFNVRFKLIDTELPGDTINIEFEVIKYRGSQKDIRGTKFSVNIPNFI